MSRALLALLLLASPATALANPTELIGFGTHGPARGNAMVASDDALSAAIYNAAAAPLGENREIGVGWTYGIVDLDIDGRDPNVLDAHGSWLATDFPFSITEDLRAGFALALYLPDQFLARISALPATEAHLVLWDNRPHRIVVNATLALRISEVLSFGAGLTFFADAGGKGVDLSIEALPGRTVADAEVDVELPMRRAPVLGLLWTPTPDLRFGVRYTGEISLDVQIDVRTTTVVPGTSLGGNVLVSVNSVDYFTPRELAIGAEFAPGPWTFAAEIAWQEWSALRQIASDVEVAADLGIDITILGTLFPQTHLRDVWVPRVGIEHRLDLREDRELALRAGYWYARSPIPDQTGLTSFADADRHCATLGAAYSFLAWEVPVTLELALQGQLAPRRETRKDRAFLPGGDFTTGGGVYVLSLGARVEL